MSAEKVRAAGAGDPLDKAGNDQESTGMADVKDGPRVLATWVGCSIHQLR